MCDQLLWWVIYRRPEDGYNVVLYRAWAKSAISPYQQLHFKGRLFFKGETKLKFCSFLIYNIFEDDLLIIKKDMHNAYIFSAL